MALRMDVPSPQISPRETGRSELRISAKRLLHYLFPGQSHGSLQSAFYGGKDNSRKAGQRGLFGHTFHPYSDRLFVFKNQRNRP